MSSNDVSVAAHTPPPASQKRANTQYFGLSASVTVSPDTATVMPGQTLLLSATVVTQNFASKAVEWSVAPTTEGTDDIEGVTINVYGELTIPADITAGTSITVTATSVADSTKTDTAVITVYDPD